MNHARKCIDATLVNSAGSLVSIGRGWETPLRPRGRPTAGQRRALPHASHRCASGLLRRRAKRFFHRPKMKLSSVPRRVPCGMQKPLCPPAPPAWGKCGAPPPTANGRWGALKSTHPHGFSRSRLPLCNRPERAHQAIVPLALWHSPNLAHHHLVSGYDFMMVYLLDVGKMSIGMNSFKAMAILKFIYP